MEERVLEALCGAPRRVFDVLFAGAIYRNLGLVRSLTECELAVRSRGSWLGLCWPALQLLLLAVYTLVSVTSPGIYDGNLAGYAVVVFAGLVTFNIFAESVRLSGVDLFPSELLAFLPSPGISQIMCLEGVQEFGV